MLRLNEPITGGSTRSSSSMKRVPPSRINISAKTRPAVCGIE